MSSLLPFVVFLLTIQWYSSVVDASVNAWSTWTPWSSCGAHDYGRQTRFRNCQNANGKISTSSQCSGLSKRTRQCQNCSYSLFNGESKSLSTVRDIKLSGIIETTKTVWCLSRSAQRSQYIEISFQNFVQLTGIGTRGNGNGHVKKYKIEYSYNGKIWFFFSNDEFAGNVDNSRLFKNTFKSRLVARSIRVYPTSFTAGACFKLQLYGCEYNCGGLITHSALVIRPPSANKRIEEIDCLWRIDSQDATKLQLKFPYFNLLCKNGLLGLYDGSKSPNSEENLSEAFCGKSGEISAQFFESRALWMHYNTNATRSDIGFNIQVNTFVLKTMNTTSGKIIVPKVGHSSIYRYSWIITAPRKNDTIQVTLDYFLSNNTRTFGTKCVADVIAINHGNGVVERYCETKQRRIFTSTTGYMKIKYKSRTDSPNWSIKFSYQILGYPETVYTNEEHRDVFTLRSQPEDSTSIPLDQKNDTNVEATQKKQFAESSSKLPVILSTVLAVLIAIVCVIALVHYLKRRNEYLRKHPYDCSNRPMSHFGDQDATPFINTNLLMWNDAKDSEKSKNFEKSKKSLPQVEVAIRRESEPQRLSIIPAEMLKSGSEVSFGLPENEGTGTLKVSDNFTEECMKLLTGLEGNNDEYSPGEEMDLLPDDLKGERYGSLPEADRRSPEVDDGQDSLPEAEGQSPETDKLLQTKYEK